MRLYVYVYAEPDKVGIYRLVGTPPTSREYLALGGNFLTCGYHFESVLMAKQALVLMSHKEFSVPEIVFTTPRALELWTETAPPFNGSYSAESCWLRDRYGLNWNQSSNLVNTGIDHRNARNAPPKKIKITYTEKGRLKQGELIPTSCYYALSNVIPVIHFRRNALPDTAAVDIILFDRVQTEE